MKTRIVHTRFWEDDKVAKLSIGAKLLFIYFFTNSRVNLIGLYELADRIISFETGLNQEELDKAKNELQDSLRIIFYDEWVYVVNAEKHSDYVGEKNDIAKNKEAKIIPDAVVNYIESLGFNIPHRYSIATTRTYKQKSENNNIENDEINLDGFM